MNNNNPGSIGYEFMQLLIPADPVLINLRCWVNITGNRFFTSKRSSVFRCHPHQCGLQISNEVLDEGRAYFRHFWPISDLFSLTISAITGHLLFNIQLSYSMVILYNLYMSLLPIKSVCSYIIAYKNSYLALNWAWLLYGPYFPKDMD